MTSIDEHAVALELPGGAQALFTTRASGNLSLSAGADHEQGLQMRDRLCDELGLQWLCAGPQVHGSHVRTVARRTERRGRPVAEAADGHATALRGVGMMVLAADCVPVILSAAGGASAAVAALHAGWRGMAAGVLEQGLATLSALAPDSEIHAVIGPCAGSCCYEVGAEVLSALRRPGPPPGASKAMLDLRAAARERLGAAGVADIRDVDLCTICDRRLFSHRREGAAAGRQGAVAWLP
jgi:YfiH family protein